MKKSRTPKLDGVMLSILLTIFLVFYHAVLLVAALMVSVRKMRERLLQVDAKRCKKIDELVAEKLL